MQREGGCDRLENSQFIDRDENLKYSNCGTKNNIKWEIEGNVISDQRLILIKYDHSSKQIIVQG